VVVVVVIGLVAAAAGLAMSHKCPLPRKLTRPAP
jgi:hypothetical protein